jgi:predicted nucleotidyltransferase component of viral defense system
MHRPEAVLPRYHHDPAFFTEAIAFTAARLGFVPALIEKDYFSSLVLAYLAGALNETLVFKGGTCLTKVHAGFYRLSEDLDFTMPMPIDARRSDRSRTIKPVKLSLREMCERLPELREEETLRGADSSRQYVGSLSYESLLQRRRETIKIEISLREPLLQKVSLQGATTILMNPLSQRSLMAPVRLACITKPEALAEKCRAAMTRREPAIRDYFDIDYAVRNGEIDPSEASWLRMVREKIAVPGNESVAVSVERLHTLRSQVEPFLKPVLRTKEFQEFDLDRAFGVVANVAAAVKAA